MKKFETIIPLLIIALLMVACGGGDKAVSDGELHITFDGESCIYEGPTLLKAGRFYKMGKSTSSTCAMMCAGVMAGR